MARGVTLLALLALVAASALAPLAAADVDCSKMAVTQPEHNSLLPNDVSVSVKIALETPQEVGLVHIQSRCEDEVAQGGGGANFTFLSLRSRASSVTGKVPAGALSRCKAQKMELNFTAQYNQGTKCSVVLVVQVQSDHLAATYVVASSMSVIGCCVMMYLYLRYEQLRAWPSTMVFWRTFCHLLLAASFLYINSWEVADHHSDATCNFLIAALTQLALLGSLGWYFCLALNFFFSISNPFRRPQSLLGRYHAGVWTSSLSTAAYTMLNWGYRVDFQLCWIEKTEGINVSNWVVYGIWLVVIGGASIVIMVIGWYRLSRPGREHTLDKRKDSLRQTRTYVLVFSCYWIVLSSLWGTVYVISSGDVLVQNTALSALFAIVIGGIGVVDVGTWIFIQWEPLQQARREEQEELSESSSFTSKRARREFDDISDALRHEFIAVISKGLENATDPNNPAAKAGQRQVSSAHSPEISLSSRSNRTVSVSIGHPSGADDSDGTAPLLGSSVAEESAGQTWTDASDTSFRFTAYGEALFADLRERVFGVSNRDFRRSVGLLDGEDEANPGKRHRGSMAERDAKVDRMVQHFSEGASGSFFYFTLDRRYMIKTLPEAEAHTLLRVLPDYYRYLHANPDSLLSRFFGLYSVRMYGHTQYVLVMNNALRTPHYKVVEKYDLKGSTVKRHGRIINGKGTKKDNDLTQPVQVGRNTAEAIKAQCKSDAEFLKSQRLMDYSLLIGVHICAEPRTGNTHCGNKQLPALRRSPSAPADAADAAELAAASGAAAAAAAAGGGEDESKEDGFEPGDARVSRHAMLKSARLCGPGVYHFAIIDLLQEWTWEKKMERWFKILFRFHCHDAKWISAVEPRFYCRRFAHMLDRVFEVHDDATAPIRPVDSFDSPPQANLHRRLTKKLFSRSVPTAAAQPAPRSGAGAGGRRDDGTGGGAFATVTGVSGLVSPSGVSSDQWRREGGRNDSEATQLSFDGSASVDAADDVTDAGTDVGLDEL